MGKARRQKKKNRAKATPAPIRASSVPTPPPFRHKIRISTATPPPWPPRSLQAALESVPEEEPVTPVDAETLGLTDDYTEELSPIPLPSLSPPPPPVLELDETPPPFPTLAEEVPPPFDLPERIVKPQESLMPIDTNIDANVQKPTRSAEPSTADPSMELKFTALSTPILDGQVTLIQIEPLPGSNAGGFQVA